MMFLSVLYDLRMGWLDLLWDIVNDLRIYALKSPFIMIRLSSVGKNLLVVE